MGKPSDIILIDQHYQKQVEAFLSYQNLLGYDTKSNKVRYGYLREFLHYLETQHKLNLTEIIPADVVAYSVYLSQRPNKSFGGLLSKKSIHAHMRVIKDFFVMLHNQGYLSVNPCSVLHFPYPKDQSTSRQVLSQAEIRQIYAATLSAHERAILALGYGCGLRSGELEACNIDDVRLREKILIVPKGKGTKKRIVPLSAGIIKDLSDYFYSERYYLTLCPRYNSNNNAFLLNYMGARMRPWTANSTLRDIIGRTENETLQQKQVSMHTLRHSIASHLLEQGVSIYQVRLFLGHSLLETTQIYTHINRQQLKDLMQ